MEFTEFPCQQFKETVLALSKITRKQVLFGIICGQLLEIQSVWQIWSMSVKKQANRTD